MSDAAIDLRAPAVQGLVLFEHYEANGALLAVSSTVVDLPPMQDGDYVVRRAWATAARPEAVHLAVVTSPGPTTGATS